MTTAIVDRESGTGRTRMVLIAILVLLFLLLMVLAIFAYRLLQPAGKPDAESLPPGIEWVRSIYGYGPSEAEQFYRPEDADIAPDGTIWGVDSAHTRILGFNPDGSFKVMISTGGRADQPGRMQLVSGIATDEDGNVFACDFGREKVISFSEEGEFLLEWDVPLPIECDVRGDTVAVCTAYGVALFDRKGTPITKFGTRGSREEQFDGPHGIALGEDGTVYVSDTENNRVKAYTQDGDLLWIRGVKRSEAAGETEDESPFQIPAGMTVDDNGRVVLVDPFQFQILVLDPNNAGEVVGEYGDFGTEDGRFVYPTGIGYDASRDWFVVADTTNDRLQVVRIPGSSSNPFSAIRRLLTGPWWICSIPLILLLIAFLVAASSRRRRSGEESAQLDARSPQGLGVSTEGKGESTQAV
ncbi:MAG: hypothetical protein OEV43_08480 [Coriobacteriia bacterium]|nr:hypothetical protein [Coriobacteriia bacterium]